MKLLKLDEITGEEILARSIMTEDYQELISEGGRIRKEYIPKLRELGITEVYVKDEKIDAESIVILKKEVNKKCKEKVQQIISKHTYRKSEDMIEISKTADNIISNILEKEEVIEQIYDIRERSADIYEHSISTCTLATLVSLKLQTNVEAVHEIGVGCLLHDLGLRYVTVKFDNTDIDKMTDRDMDEYKKHPIYGYSAVKNEEWLSKTSKEIILCHHERMDGSGYPLHATEISMETIGCDRLKVYEVVEYLKTYKGILFDEKVVDVLLEFTAVYPSGSKVLTNEGETAIVIKQNKHFPERPVLQMITNKEGKNLETIVVKDLLQNNNIFIEKVLN